MRALNKKLKKYLNGFELDELIKFVVYNELNWYKNRNYSNRQPRELFENWFDKKDRLIKDLICNCDKKDGNTTIDWLRYGNKCKFKRYRDFLELDTDIINREQIFPNIFDESMNCLGTYRSMSSPGLITLHMDNIQVFFWSIICSLTCEKGYVFTREKIEELAKLCILKTLYHELFHHVIDAQKYFLNNYHYDYYIDEALAVACSRHLVGFEAQFNLPFVSDFLDLAYSYNQPGYRDWVKYKSDEQFLIGLSRYTGIDRRLMQIGQETTPIAEGILYSIFENPNVVIEINI
jgi:hypothetical protein